MINDYLRFIANYMASQKGLNALFSNVGFGKTTFLLHLIGAFNDIGKNCLLFSLEMSEQQIIDRMDQLKINRNGVTILDNSLCSIDYITDTIRKEKPQCVFVDYLQLIQGNMCEVLTGLKGAAEQFSIPVVFTGQLPRCSGDYDFFHHNPELYDLTYLFPSDTPLRSAGKAIDEMGLILFLHRHHDCVRGIGTADRYNISNATELITRQRYYSDLPGSYYFDFRELMGKYS